MISFLVRLVLGTLLMFAFHKFQKAVNLQFGPTVAAWLLIITASQFHLMFYISRPLPNIFALFLGNNKTFKWSFMTKRKLFNIEKSIYMIFFFFNTVFNSKCSIYSQNYEILFIHTCNEMCSMLHWHYLLEFTREMSQAVTLICFTIRFCLRV